MLEVVVVGVDGSAIAGDAVRHAAELAAPAAARLVLVHVFEPLAHLGEVEPPVDFAALEAAAARRLGSEWCEPCRRLEVTYATRVEEGDIVQALLDVADEEDADLIVVGSRGLSGLAGVVLGSTSSKLLHRSSRPVLVVPPSDRR